MEGNRVIHTVELTRIISKEQYEQIANSLHMAWYGNKKLYISTQYASLGFPVIRLYKIKKTYKNESYHHIFYMIAITVNIQTMLDCDPNKSISLELFVDIIYKSIYSEIFKLMPCLEFKKRLSFEEMSELAKKDINAFYEEERQWSVVNGFKVSRIDFSFDFWYMPKEYLALLNKGYCLRKNAYEHICYNNENMLNDILDDEPDIPDIEEETQNIMFANPNNIYYKCKSLNVNIYHKATELKDSYPNVYIDDKEYNFLRIEIQAKKNKLNAIVRKFGLESRQLHCLAIPEVWNYLLESYMKMLAGTGHYVTYNRAMDIINRSSYTERKKKRLKDVIKAVSKKHGIAKLLEQVEQGKVTDLGKLDTVKQYLRDISWV